MTDAREVMKRRRNSLRRRRILAALGAGAVVSLVLAIVAASQVWLAVAILFDIVFAGYVTLLLMAQQTAAPVRAPVVPLRIVEEHDVAPATVRVVAG